MEGPSLYLAAEQLAPFVNKIVKDVSGNTTIGKERIHNKKIKDIFSWGKHLVFQFDTFALRVHFMLFGSFQATVKKVQVTGDYPKKNRIPHLAFVFENGHIEMYSCSLKYIESNNAKAEYDFTTSIMSPLFDEEKAYKNLKSFPEEQISDLLLDQNFFAGVGNIIRNEVLFIVKINPQTKVKALKPVKLKEIVKTTKEFVFKFYEWRKAFVLRKHYQIYKKRKCRVCEGEITKEKTGKRERVSYYCRICQKEKL